MIRSPQKSIGNPLLLQGVTSKVANRDTIVLSPGCWEFPRCASKEPSRIRVVQGIKDLGGCQLLVSVKLSGLGFRGFM